MKFVNDMVSINEKINFLSLKIVNFFTIYCNAM